MAELGETWSYLDAGTSKRVEAVVIATGPSIVRLVDRFGRRITFPTSSFSSSLQRVRPSPSSLIRCHKCTQLAYFRFIDWDMSHVWSCEDHLPHGIPAYFPGETPSPASPGLGMACPRCHSTGVAVEATRVPLPRQRSTIRCACENCHVLWSPLISAGMSDDGATLAADLRQLIEGDPSLVEVRVGFTTYRNLCRTLNMGNVTHLMGVPVSEDSTLGDLLSFAFSRRGSLEASFDSLIQIVEAQRPLAQFCTAFRPVEVVAGSVWHRLTTHGIGTLTCHVISEVAGEVTYELTDSGRGSTQNLRDFRTCWAPGDAQSQPRETSVWTHRETGLVIQVLVATPTQAANQQVHYVTSAGRHETTPLRTFQRLYRELPSPPEDHIWSWQEGLFEVERRGDSAHLQPLSASGAPAVLKTATLYSTCRPLVFTQFITNVRRGMRWIHKCNPAASVIVVDIGAVQATLQQYVLFRGADATRGIEGLEAFCDAYEYQPPPPPCRAGETWVSLKDSTRQLTICHEDAPSDQALVEWRDGTTDVLPYERLVAEYRKLDIRSYWQMLDDENED